MRTDTNDIWAFIECDGAGVPRRVGLEMLTKGRELADQLGSRLAAVVITAHADQAAELCVRYGPDQIIIAEHPCFADYTTDAYANALVHLVEKYRPGTLLIGATGNGRDLAPRVSCRLQTGLTADCTGVEVERATGNILWTRPAFGQNLLACITCPEHRPQMGTIRPGVFRQQELEGKNPEYIRESIPISEVSVRTRVLELLRDMEEDGVDLELAEIIVSGGYGVGGPQGFEPIRELAQALGGTVGASRAAVDAGWISRRHQVGQTGKTVSPKLYIACGISGAVQHLAGIGGAETLVVINRDPDAPIFRMADYGVVGDLFEVLPALTDEIKKHASK